MPGRKLWAVVRDAGAGWLDHDAMRLSAAVAFYTILSLAPLLVIAVAIAGFVFDAATVRKQLLDQFEGMVGTSGADVIAGLLKNANDRPHTGALATAVGVVTLLFGASGVFGELQSALNTIWGVKPKPGRGVWGFVHDRFLSFAMVLVIGFLLLVTLVLSTALSATGAYLEGLLPGLSAMMRFANCLLSFAVVSALFAAMFKVLPDVRIGWREVGLGAVVTAALFTLGKYLIGLYIGKAGVETPFGAAGSVVALVVWVYYSGLILFFGAELTQVVARRSGAGRPTSNAEWVTPPAAAPQAVPAN